MCMYNVLAYKINLYTKHRNVKFDFEIFFIYN